MPWAVFRHAMVVVDSATCEMDKIDGQCCFIRLIQRVRYFLASRMPSVRLEGGRVNILPVDFVVDAHDDFSHQGSIRTNCYHLVDPLG